MAANGALQPPLKTLREELEELKHLLEEGLLSKNAYDEVSVVLLRSKMGIAPALPQGVCPCCVHSDTRLFFVVAYSGASKSRDGSYNKYKV